MRIIGWIAIVAAWAMKIVGLILGIAGGGVFLSHIWHTSSYPSGNCAGRPTPLWDRLFSWTSTCRQHFDWLSRNNQIGH